MRLSLSFGAIAALASIGWATPLPEPSASNVPTPASAQQMLGSLTVAPSSSTSGYSRALFPHWISQGGGCDTRDVVLKRDGSHVVTGSSCSITSGSWVSPYDGVIANSSSKLDVDHLVPLENAWISGASKWTTPQRQDFANDLVRPQLWSVSYSANRSKGDRSPDEWKPPLQSFWCTYAESFVAVKSYYKLTITSAEKSALGSMLATC